MKDYYYILGIEKDATDQEIKSAYRKLSKKFHPDNNEGDVFFKKKFQEINEAFQILNNPIKRSAYDQNNNTENIDFEPSNNGDSFRTKPGINYFGTNKSIISNGEEVKFTWDTEYANHVQILPFGNVNKRGTKTYKINNFNKEYLTFKIIATNDFGSNEKEIFITNKLVEKYINLENALVVQANKWVRLINFLVDTIAIIILSVFLGAYYNDVDEIRDVEWNILWVSSFICYYWILEALYGRTIGKLLTGTKVVTIDGRQPKTLNILGRTICRFIPFEIFSNFGNAWHDTLSKTMVVKVNQNNQH